MEKKDTPIEKKSLLIDTAAVVTAIGCAVPAGKIVGSAIRQIVDYTNKGERK